MGRITKKKVDNTHDEKENMYFNSSDFNMNKFELSGEVPNDGGCLDALFLNKPLETVSNNEGIIQNSIVEKVNIGKHTNSKGKKNDTKLEKIVFDFIKKSKEGGKISEVTELIKSIDENNNVHELLLKMIDNGIIKKRKYRYYVVEEK
jgi:hypothetical protein